jgi:hypothetical protein
MPRQKRHSLFQGKVLEALQRAARKIGYKLLQRTIISAAVPGVSIVVGAWWNKRTTKIVVKSTQTF